MQQTGINALTEREKETLRLLLAGHDAKSMARAFDLSVHTVNERLRDARRKLGVSSSREAARLLARSEGWADKILWDSPIGVAGDGADAAKGDQPDRRDHVGHRLPWLTGGMLIMSLIIAAAVFAATMQSGAGSQTGGPAAPAAQVDPAGGDAAITWAALLDAQRWTDSWSATSTLFRSKITADQWAATITPVRQPLGAVSSRTVQTVTRAASLPGAPAGDYEIVQLQTAFAGKRDAIETVVLAHEGGAWKVAGYFIK